MSSNSQWPVRPLLEFTLTVTPNINYHVNIEVMLTDLDSSNEYVDISINGNDVGRCNPNYGHRICDWYTCTISPTEATSTNSHLTIQLEYYNVHDRDKCTYDGHTAHAIARVTLTSG